MAQHICYPPESPENTSTNKMVTTDPLPAAAAVDGGHRFTAAATGADASPGVLAAVSRSPAHNHIGVGTTLVTAPMPDGGTGDGGLDGRGLHPRQRRLHDRRPQQLLRRICCQDGTCG